MKDTLYIMSSEIELLKSKDTIKCMRPDPEKPGKYKTQIFPISRLNSIEVYGNVKISTPLLKLCNELKIPCYFNTYHGAPMGMFNPENSTPSVIRLKQYETFLNKNKKLHVAKAIVSKASRERIRIIKKFDKEKKFQQKISKITHHGKKINGIKSISELRGIEGTMMKIFFNVFSKLLKNLPFHGRSQQPPKDEGNAILSFGNVVLYNNVRAVIYRCALDPLVGFLHEPHENRGSLALDLAEIFRPIIVDNLIIKLARKKKLLKSHFNKNEIKCHLNQHGKKIWISEFREFLKSSIQYTPLKRNVAVQEEIKLECYNLIKYITGEKKTYTPINFNNR